jgi:hypothetical protein
MLENLFLCGIGVRARRELRAVRVAVAPLNADFVGRIGIASLGVTAVQGRGRILNDRAGRRFDGRIRESLRRLMF